MRINRVRLLILPMASLTGKLSFPFLRSDIRYRSHEETMVVPPRINPFILYTQAEYGTYSPLPPFPSLSLTVSTVSIRIIVVCKKSTTWRQSSVARLTVDIEKLCKARYTPRTLRMSGTQLYQAPLPLLSILCAQ